MRQGGEEVTTSLTSRHLKSALISVAWNSDSWTFDVLSAHYDTLVRYLDLDDCGKVLGTGCGTPGMTGRSSAVEKAFSLGQSL